MWMHSNTINIAEKLCNCNSIHHRHVERLCKGNYKQPRVQKNIWKCYWILLKLVAQTSKRQLNATKTREKCISANKSKEDRQRTNCKCKCFNKELRHLASIQAVFHSASLNCSSSSWHWPFQQLEIFYATSATCALSGHSKLVKAATFLQRACFAIWHQDLVRRLELQLRCLSFCQPVCCGSVLLGAWHAGEMRHLHLCLFAEKLQAQQLW